MSINADSYPYLFKINDRIYDSQLIIEKVYPGSYDSNWSKEYELFYHTQHKARPYVDRVFLKYTGERGKKSRVGFVNVRPVSDGSELSEVYLSPPRGFEDDSTFIKCIGPIDDYGERLRCTPFIMPDSIFGMCIHASIWICMKILEKLGNIEKVISIPEIQQYATNSPFNDKQGLPFVQAARMLRMCKVNAFYYNSEGTQLNNTQFLFELYAYVESKLPVILGVEVSELDWWEEGYRGYHSIVAIGHLMDNNSISGFVFHDESQYPYIKMQIPLLTNAWRQPFVEGEEPQVIREMVVAVPAEVSVPFHAAFQEFNAVIESSIQRGILTNINPNLYIRPILMNVIDILRACRDYNDDCIAKVMQETSFLNYMWTFSLFENDADRRRLENAEAIYITDATGESALKIIYLISEKKCYYYWNGGVYERKSSNKKRRKIA